MQNMFELKKGRDIAVKGRKAVVILKFFRERMKKWGIPLPATDLLVLDFGLGEFPQTGLVESWICNEKDAGYCAKYLFVQKGQSCPIHRHKVKHETFFVLKGKVRMLLGERKIGLKEGDTLAVGEGVRHGFTGITDSLLLEVSKPCVITDNYFENPRIKINKK